MTLQLADFAKKGNWPVAGGMLDQTKSFIDVAQFIWNEQAHWEAEQMKMPKMKRKRGRKR